MRYAVTAATGQLGRATITALLDEQGTAAGDVVAAVRTPKKAADLAARGVVVRRADYTEPDSLREAFAGVQRVLVIPGTAMPAQRVPQLQNTLDAARDAQVRHVLHFGLVGTHPDNGFAIMPYLLYAESALRLSGMDWTLLRNALYAEPILDWVDDIVRMGTIPYPTGEGRHAYASRRDLARAGAAALTTDGHEGQIYELTGPAALTTRELCEAVARATGARVEHREATVDDYVRACLQGGMSEPVARFMATLYDPIRQGLSAACTDHVERLTGRPPASLQELLSHGR